MTITALPTPPSRSDSANFATRGDAFLAALPTFATEANALQVDVNAKYNELASSYQSAANIAIAANTATSQAAAAVVAKDAAVAAWAASTSPAETLASISKSLHYGAVVKAIIYDTSKDSDGGAWRKRCADKSWYTESLGFTGTWGGQAASNAAGWAACGSVTGGAYQSTADGKFYTPLSSSTQTEISRGNVREFPEQVAIVAETGRVVIYDLTQAGTPMWMVFGASTSLPLYADVVASVAAVNGAIYIGSSSTSGALTTVSFITDNFVMRNNLFAYDNIRSVSQRASSNTLTARTSGGLVNRQVNSVALTVLDNAPIDAATGVPTPTIAVATAGGISVIKDDGTVVNSSQTDATGSVAFSGSTLYISNRSGAAAHARFTSVVGLGASWTPTTLYNYLVSGGTYDESKVVSYGKGVSTGGNSMLALYKHNPASSNSSLRAQITIAYNSGWLPGDIRGAHLADTVAETITGSGELVTNGTFATDTTGWTTSGATFVQSGGAAVLTNSGAAAGFAYQAITTVVGKTYVVSANLTLGTATAPRLAAGSTGTGTELGVAQLTATGVFVLSFVATGTTTYITATIPTATGGLTATYDNISCKLAEPDRSVKNKGLTLVGSLTKAAVASGAALVAYSGFSSSNYLEQPYNSDLDFGTGDFCVMGWVNITNLVAGVQGIVDRGTAASGRFGFHHNNGLLYCVCAANAVAVSTGYTFSATGLYFCSMYRVSGVLYVHVNGVQVYTAANTSNVTNTSCALNFGVVYDHGNPLYGSLALWRISATAPSADQIAHIYRTELPLFQASAQCTIAGSYAGVTALSYDDVADTLHVGTTYGRSGFRDLLRIDSEATTVGAVTSLSANQGAVLTGGAASGRYYQPAMLLRDELRRKEEARRALGKVPVFFDYTATASQTAFVLPKGYTAKALYHNGTLKRETTTGVYWTRSNDGFAETCTLSAGATVSDWISIMAVRA